MHVINVAVGSGCGHLTIIESKLKLKVARTRSGNMK